MKEATEIARLRLFLKLVSAIDDRKDLEPLPDLDFNIKAGNILVGARTVDEIRDTTDLFAAQTIEGVLERAERRQRRLPRVPGRAGVGRPERGQGST